MPNKKRFVETVPEDDVDMSSSDSDDSDDDTNGRHPEAYSGNEEIQVEFEGRNPTEGDLPGISQLVKQLFLKAHISFSELSNIIIGQGYIGSVITQCEDDEGPDDEDDDEDMYDSNVVFGITTAINLTQRKQQSQCVQDLISFLQAKAQETASAEDANQFTELLNSDSQSVGLLLNERFINIPPQISVPMLENLQKELKRAVEKQKLVYFENFIIIMKFYRKLAKGNNPAEDLYSNEEEEAICKFGTMSFEYSVEDEADTGVSGDWLENDKAMKPYRKVVVIPTSKFPDIIDTIKDFIQ